MYYKYRLGTTLLLCFLVSAISAGSVQGDAAASTPYTTAITQFNQIELTLSPARPDSPPMLMATSIDPDLLQRIHIEGTIVSEQGAESLGHIPFGRDMTAPLMRDMAAGDTLHLNLTLYDVNRTVKLTRPTPLTPVMGSRLDEMRATTRSAAQKQPQSNGATYQLRTSNDGSVSYAWNDISGSGQPVFLPVDYYYYYEGGESEFPQIQNFDDNVAVIPIGFTFPFFDETYSELTVGVNGLVGFGFPGQYSTDNNTPLPSVTSPSNMIAWLWSDLYLDPNGSILHETVGEQLIIQFNDLLYYDDINGVSGTITAQLILSADGDILIQYDSDIVGITQPPLLPPETSASFQRDLSRATRTQRWIPVPKKQFQPPSSYTVGLQNEDGTDGLLVAYNNLFVQPQLAVQFDYIVPEQILIDPEQSRTAAPSGAAAMHILTVRNDLPITTTIALTVSGNSTVSPTTTAPLPSGGTQQLIVNVPVPSGVVTGTADSNLLTATALSGTVAFTDTALLLSCAAACTDLSVVQTVDINDPTSAGNAVWGERVYYRVAVRNDGDESVNDATLTIDLPPNIDTGMINTYSSGDLFNIGFTNYDLGTPTVEDSTFTWVLGNVAPEGYGDFTLYFNLPIEPTADNQFTSTSTISAAEADSVPDNNSATASFIVTDGDADLFVSKSIHSGSFFADEDVTYRIYWRNEGNGVARNVVLTDTLPISMTHISNNHYAYAPSYQDRPYNVTVSGQTIALDIGDMPTNSSGYLDIVARIDPAATGILTNSVTIYADADIDLANNSYALGNTISEPSVDVRVTNYLNSGVFAPNNEAIYRIYWSNQGDLAAENVIITNTLPAELSYVSQTGYSYEPTYNGQPPALITSGNTLIWSLGTVEPNSYGYINVTVRMDGSVTAGTQLTNQVVIETSSPETTATNNSNSDVRTVQAAVPDMYTQIYEQNTAYPNNDLQHDIYWHNQGTGTAATVQIIYDMPPELSFQSETFNQNTGDSVTPTLTISGTQYVWTLNDVNPNDSGTIEIFSRLSETALVGSTLTHIVQIPAVSTEIDLSDNLFTRTETVRESTPNINVTKRIGSSTNSSFPLDSLVVWNLTYGHSAYGQPSTNVVISDTLPIGTTFERAEWWPDGSIATSVPVSATVNGQTVQFSLGAVNGRDTGIVRLYARTAPTLTLGTQLINNATITAAIDTDPTNNSGTATATIVEPLRDLDVDTYRDSNPPVIGEEVQYRTTIYNRRAGTVENVVLTNTLPISTTFVRADDGNGNPITPVAITTDGNGRQRLRWEVGDVMGTFDLFDGYYRTVRVWVTVGSDVPVGTPLLFESFSIGSSIENPNSNQNGDTVLDNALGRTRDLNVAISASPATVYATQQVYFNVTVRNQGTLAAANNVVTVTIPAGMTYSSVSGIDSGWTVIDTSNQQVVLSNPSFPTNGYTNFYVYGTVDETVTINDILIGEATAATSDPDSDDTDDSAVAQMTVGSANRNFTISKEVSEVTADYQANSRVTWRISYYNSSDITEQNVIITDTLPAGMVYDSAFAFDDSSGWRRTIMGNTVTWTNPAVPRYGNGSLYISGIIDGALPATTVLTNTLSQSADDLPSITVTDPITVQAPLIAIDPAQIDPFIAYVGYPSTFIIDVSNAEVGTLAVSAADVSSGLVTAVNAAEQVTTTRKPITITFTPTTTGTFTETVTLTSNSHLSGTLSLTFVATVLEPPVAEIDPAALAIPMDPDEQLTETITLSNTGDSPLTFSLLSQTSLEDSLAGLDESFADITANIPNLYLFSNGTSNTYINDGGGDMYDNGNYLSTDLGGSLTYNDGVLNPSTLLGAEGEYFTRKHPGLFVFAADLDGINEFRITGGLGADGGGAVDGVVLNETINGTLYRGFVKRVYNTNDPSVNHLIIVADDDATHTFSTNSNIDEHTVFNLNDATRLYYVLYASASGGYVDDATTRTIMRSFLSAIGTGVGTEVPWLTVTPLTGTVPISDSVPLQFEFDTTGLVGGIYTTTVNVATNDPDRPTLSIPINLTIGGEALPHLEPAILDFGTVFNGVTTTITTTLFNDGTAILNATIMDVGNGAFTAAPTTLTIPPFGSQDVTLTLLPTITGTLTTTVVITTDAPLTPTLQLPLTVNVVDPPIISADPNPIETNVASDTTRDIPLTITNDGASPLEWTADIQYGANSTSSAVSTGLTVAVVGSDSSFANTLSANPDLSDYTFTDVGNNYTFTALDPYNLVLVNEGDAGISTAEAQALQTYHDTGRPILAGMDDFDTLDATARAIVFNIFGVSNALDATLSSGSVTDHPIAEGITAVGSVGTDNDYFTPTTAEPVVVDSSGRAFMLADDTAAPTVIFGEYLSGWYNSNTDLVVNTLAWAGVNWLSLGTESGTIPAGQSATITVTVDATGLITGTYTGAILLNSNDPVTPLYTVPITVNVTAEAIIIVEPAALDYGDVYEGYATIEQVTIRNEGGNTLQVTSITADNPAVTIAPSTLTLLPYRSGTVDVMITPLDDMPITSTVTIESNAADTPTITVGVTATVVPAPDIAVSPLGFNWTQDTGGVTTRTLTINNSGLGDLTFDLMTSNSNVVLSPTVGTLAQGETAAITLLFDSTTRPNGFYSDLITVNSNDPDEAAVQLPVNINVSLAPPAAPINPTPTDDALNAEINGQLRWQGSIQAATYDLYLWPADETKPAQPTAAGLIAYYANNEVRYTPTTLDTNTEYRWQVVARNQVGNATGAEWSFTTETLPELSVTSISVPPSSFSGQTIALSWVVTNNGDRGTNQPTWYERVYISQAPVLNTSVATQLGEVTNASYLGVGESYQNSADFALPNGLEGAYYVHVVTDSRNGMRETDDSNNAGDSLDTTVVSLTTPPDLFINEATAPVNVFSGQVANVNWTVENQGGGLTSANAWSDTVYLSIDDVLDNEDTQLSTVTHNGILAAGQTYTGTASVNIPAQIFGNYFIIVRTDSSNAVYEHTGEENNSTATAVINVTLTPPPDLEVESVTVLQSPIYSGEQVDVQWIVTNFGAGGTPERYWVDDLYFSTSPTLDTNTATYMGRVNHYGEIAADASYTATRRITLPDGIQGTYYFHVAADGTNRVFEYTYENNNNGSTAPLPIELSLSPDLQVVSANTPIMTGTIGSTLNVGWQVSNLGSAGTAVTWYDALYISPAPTWSPNGSIYLQRYLQTESLGIAETYTETRTTILPSTLAPGIYYLYAVTDYDDDVYEHNAQDNNASDPIQIRLVAPTNSDLFAVTDLAVQSAAASTMGDSGQPITVTWTAANTSADTTGVSSWKDRVYLSTDGTLDTAADTILGEQLRYDVLTGNETYTVSATFPLPNGIDGEYTLLVTADADENVNDDNRTNNTFTIAEPISVTLSPSADLALTDLTVPADGIIGQPIDVSWTVQNSGETDATGGWYDTIYFSYDTIIDASDRTLASIYQATPLPMGDSQTYTRTVNVPNFAAGAYYILVKTDNRDDLYEHNAENNNQREETITIEVPPPSDLTVYTVTVPADGVSGETIMVDWVLANVGANSATGQMCEVVFISADDIWDINDIPLGEQCRTVSIPAGTQQRRSLKAAMPTQALLAQMSGTLPGLSAGNYHAIVRTDIRNQIPESDEGNNIGVSDGTINVGTLELLLGVPTTRTVSGGESIYYRLTVTETASILVELDGALETTANELYIRYGDMPTRNQYDFVFDAPFAPDQEILLPRANVGDYYILVYGAAVPAPTAYDLVANVTVFSIRSSEPEAAGNAGQSTLELKGAQFTNDTTFALIASDGTEIATERTLYEDSGTVYATFDLTAVPTGTYTIKGTLPDGTIATLDDGLIVETGTGGRIELNITGPSSLRPDRDYVIFAEYSNAGDGDVIAPLLTLSNPNLQEVGFLPDALMTDARLKMMGIGRSGPAGILRIGERHTIPFYLHTTTTRLEFLLQALQSDFDEPIDWADIEEDVRPNNVTDAEWDVAWPALQARVGTTWGDYVAALAETATFLSSRGEYTNDVELLFNELLNQQLGVSTSIIAGQLVSAEEGRPLPNNKVIAISTTPSDPIITDYTDGIGNFKLDELPAGTYNVYAEGVYFTSRLSYTVAAGSDVTGLLIEGVRVDEETIPTVPKIPSDSAPTLVTDDAGQAHMVWARDEQLWHSVYSDTGWTETVPISAAIGTTPDVAYTSALSGSATAGFALSYVNQSEAGSFINSVIGRPDVNGDIIWSMPITLTSDAYADESPTVTFDQSEQILTVWQQHDTTTDDDYDLYFNQTGSVSFGYWLVNIRSRAKSDQITWIELVDVDAEDVLDVMRYAEEMATADSRSTSEYCAGIEVAKGTDVPLPMIGGKYGFAVSFKACGSIGCSMSVNGSGNLQVDVSKQLSVRGSAKAEAKWEANKKTCEYDFKSGSLELGAGIDRNFPVGDTLQAFGQTITLEGGIKLTGDLGGTAAWEGANFPGLPNKGSVKLAVGASVYGKAGIEVGVKVFGFEKTVEVVGNVGGGGNVSITWNFPGETKPEYCLNVTVSGNAGPLSAEYSKKWGTCASSRHAGYAALLKNAPAGSYVQIEQRMIDGVPTEEVLLVTVNPTVGTGNVYEETPVLSSTITADLANDGKPDVARSGQNEVLMTWSKDSADYNTTMGSSIQVATFDGTAWNTPTVLTDSTRFNQDPSIAFDGTDDPMIVWSSAAMDGISLASTVTDVISAMSDSDIYMSRRISGTWSTPVPVATIDGGDNGVTLAANGAEFTAAWVNDNNGVETIYAAQWDGAVWTLLPTITVTTTVQHVDVAYNGTTPLVVWSQSDGTAGTIDGTSDGVATIYTASWDGTAWSSSDALEKPDSLSEEGTLFSSVSTTRSADNNKMMEEMFLAEQRAIEARIGLPEPPEDCCECDPATEDCCDEPNPPDECEDDDDPDPDPDPPPPPPKPRKPYDPPIPVSSDPNDILGPDGYGDARWVAVDETLDFTIRFENDPIFATAPAADVIVTQQFDDDLDIRRFRLSSFGFGEHIFTVPDNSSFYSERLDLTEDLGVFVDVVAGIDLVERSAFWRFNTIDPATGALTTDALGGFLPPNLADGEGEGFVSYSIRANRTAETGAVIDSEARIFFDSNDPIDTPPIFNTIDADPPTSTIDTLAAENVGTEIILTWESDDPAGSGLRAVDVYVSDNGTPFTLMERGETADAAVFTGEVGHEYRFYTLAEDNTGNRQGTYTSATVTIILDDPAAGLIITDSGTADFGALTTLTATVDMGTNVVYEWDLGDGTTGTGGIISHTYSTVGTFTATVTATNTADTITATTTVEVVDIPIVGFTIGVENGSLVLGETAVLTANVESGSNVVYTWDLGDGTVIDSVSGAFAYVYAADGTYTVQITATNAAGTETRTLTIDVIAPTPTPTSVPTDTPIPTATSQPTATFTPTLTSTLPPTTPTEQPTNTPVPVATNTSVPLPTETATSTPTEQPTNTPVPVETNTPVPLPTETSTSTPTVTPTATETGTPTLTPTEQPTNTPVPVATNTSVPLPATDTPQPGETAVPVPTNTSVPIATNTSVPLPTATATLEPTETATPTETAVPTATSTPRPTNTSVPVATNTSVPLPTATDVPPTSTPRPTNTPVPVATNTSVPLPATNTPQAGETAVPVPTNTAVPVNTNTPVPLPTATDLPTSTPQPTNTSVPVATNTPVPIPATNTPQAGETAVPIPTNTSVPVATNTSVPLPTETPMTPTNTPRPTNTPVPVPTNTSVPLSTDTPMLLPTETVAPTATVEPTATPLPDAVHGVDPDLRIGADVIAGDGVTIVQMEIGLPLILEVEIWNETGMDAELTTFVDLDGDGAWSESETARLIVESASFPQTVLLSFGQVVTADTISARFRLSTEMGLPSFGSAADGEVTNLTLSVDGIIDTDTNTNTVNGNVNCDRTYNIVDALFIAQYTVGLRQPEACPLTDITTQFDIAGCDVNRDGVCNIVDALFIAQCTVGIENVFCP